MKRIFVSLLTLAFLLTNTVGSVAFAADNVLEFITVMDLNSNGKVDSVGVAIENTSEFDSTIFSNDGWSVSYNGDPIAIDSVSFFNSFGPDIIRNSNAADLPFQLSLDENSLPVDTSPAGFKVSYVPQGVDQGSEYSDVDNIQLLAIGEQVADTDSAAPRIVSFSAENQTFRAAGDYLMVLLFSEDIAVLPQIITYTGAGDDVVVTPQVATNCNDADARTVCFTYLVFINTQGTQGLGVAEAGDEAGNFMDDDIGRLFAFDTLGLGDDPAPSEADNVAPFVVTVSSDGQTFNAPGVQNIMITFNEDINIAPTVVVDGGEVVDDCGDEDQKTFCFDYMIPDQVQQGKAINISGAIDWMTTEMLPDSTHIINIATVTATPPPAPQGGGGVGMPHNQKKKTPPVAPVQPPVQPGPAPQEPVLELTSAEEPGLTRAEVVKMAMDAFGIKVPEGYVVEGKPFTDVETDSKFAAYIALAKKHGIVRGYGPGFTEFKSDRIASRAEALQIFLEAASVDTKEGSIEDLNFLDIVYPDAWYIRYVLFAIENNVLPGYNGEYKPDQSISKSELESILDATLELK